MTKEIRDKIKKYGLKVDHLSKCKEYETLKKLLNEINANLKVSHWGCGHNPGL